MKTSDLFKPSRDKYWIKSISNSVLSTSFLSDFVIQNYQREHKDQDHVFKAFERLWYHSDKISQKLHTFQRAHNTCICIISPISFHMLRVVYSNSILKILSNVELLPKYCLLTDFWVRFLLHPDLFCVQKFTSLKGVIF